MKAVVVCIFSSEGIFYNELQPCEGGDFSH